MMQARCTERKCIGIMLPMSKWIATTNQRGPAAETEAQCSRCNKIKTIVLGAPHDWKLKPYAKHHSRDRFQAILDELYEEMQ